MFGRKRSFVTTPLGHAAWALIQNLSWIPNSNYEGRKMCASSTRPVMPDLPSANTNAPTIMIAEESSRHDPWKKALAFYPRWLPLVRLRTSLFAGNTRVRKSRTERSKRTVLIAGHHMGRAFDHIDFCMRYQLL